MRSFFKLSTLALGVLTLSACNTSESDPSAGIEQSLQRHLERADVFDLRISEGDLLVTTSENMLYRLAANDDEWEPIASNSNSYNFILMPTSQKFFLVNHWLDSIRMSGDAGASWEFIGSVSTPGSNVYSSMLLIDSLVYLHAGEGLHRTYIDMSNPADSFAEVDVLHESEATGNYPFDNRVRALVYNEVGNELWWTEFYSEEGEDYRVMRIDLENDEVEQMFSHDLNPLMDGFVDHADPSTLVFAGEGGVRISHDNGENWTRHYLQEGTDPTVYSVQQDLVSLNYYAFASVEIDGVRTDQMWCSEDQGSSWESTRLGEGTSGVRNTTNSMVFLDRDGIRYFFIPTFRGLIQGPLDEVAC